MQSSPAQYPYQCFPRLLRLNKLKTMICYAVGGWATRKKYIPQAATPTHIVFATYRSQNLFRPSRCLKTKCKTRASDIALIKAITRSKATQLTGSASSVPKTRFNASLGSAQTRYAAGTAMRFRSEEATFIATSTMTHRLQPNRVK